MEQRYPPIRGVVLDADETLYTLRCSVGTTYAQVLRRFGFSTDPQAFDEALPLVWKAFEEEYLATREGHRTDPARERRQWDVFIKRMLYEVGVRCPSKTITEALYTEYARGDLRTLSAGVVEFLSLARDLGIVTVVATNNDARVVSTVKELGLDSHIDHILWAGELGWKKPSPHFFHEISSRIGIDGRELLHVGNNLNLDVCAPQGAGWNALLFDPKDRGPAPKIHGFAELKCLLRERAPCFPN
jgi:FMN phosphatase YigB (HAD superfamily)